MNFQRIVTAFLSRVRLQPLLRPKIVPPRMATASRRAAGGFLFASALQASSVVFCRPLDTPDYLLPYYLRDTRSRFNHYASIKKKSGARYMTAEDFVCALLATKEKSLADPSAADDVAALFSAVDANGDGKLSFTEFSFLMMLLTTKPRDFELSFVMFDTEGKGSLSLPQFVQLVTALSDDDGSAVKRLAGGGILTKLFGPTGNGHCTHAQFRQVVDQLHVEVWKAEFRQFDRKRRGLITAEKFGNLIASQMIGSHLPFYIVANLRKLHAEDQQKHVVPFSSWVSFHRLMQNADALGEAIELFTSSGQPLRKKNLMHAVSAIGLPPLTAAEADLVFALFDRNGDGTLEYDEFISVMKNTMTFHVKEKSREKNSVFVQLGNCTLEAVDGMLG